MARRTTMLSDQAMSLFSRLFLRSCSFVFLIATSACGTDLPVAIGDSVSADSGSTDSGLLSDGAKTCSVDSDCGGVLVCGKNVCIQGICGLESNADGPCDDGDACTGTGICGGVGNCGPGKAISCDDFNTCTIDSCDSRSGCVHVNTEIPCDDGDNCTTNDQCVQGKCNGGKAPTCDDGNPCTDDGCDLKKGCSFSNNQSPCSDGNACTSADMCAGGKCVGGASILCADSNACTDDKCDGKTGNCVFLPNSVTCDDGSTFTSGDVCIAGTCVGTPGCGCVSDGQCDDKNPCTKDVCSKGGDGIGCCVAAALPGDVSCSDGNSCTIGDLCAAGTCIPGAKQKCDDGNPCTDDACLPGLGVGDSGCAHTANSASCDDGLACSSGDVCKSGKCSGNLSVCPCSSDKDCDDHNTCSEDSCLGGFCASKSSSAGKGCDDGNACTIVDLCQSGVCLSGSVTGCDDSNVCTSDFCDPASGKCVHSSISGSCDDGDKCTSNDSCEDGACKSGKAVVCDFGEPCFDFFCTPTQGCDWTVKIAQSCTNGSKCSEGPFVCTAKGCEGGSFKNCDDGNACTADSCNPESGCLSTAITGTCDDGNACTSGENCSSGACSGSIVNCDDQNACTTDSCGLAGACTHTSASGACEDGNPCTGADFCDGGLCQGGSGTVCDDGDSCTSDKCDPAGGCSHSAISDGSVCADAACDGLSFHGASTCVSGICVPASKKACDDGNPCTDDGCLPGSGCTNLSNSGSCSDGNVCTVSDFCSGGACLPGSVTFCDDGNVCSVDGCDPTSGCQHSVASDGIACASAGCSGLVFSPGGVCASGSCALGSLPVDCSDGQVCTDDFCSPTSGCSHDNNLSACSDGNACTSGDTCALGTCSPGSPTSCDDGNPCTTDSCVNPSGCVHSATGGSCDDGNLCTLGDTCAGATCSGSSAMVCNDDNVCTDDSCDGKTGCVYLANGATCSDGNACTSGDTCAGGKCGSAINPCDDGNPCTTDSCDGVGGCKHLALSDGSACSVASCSDLLFQGSAVCTSGVCGSVPALSNCNDQNGCTTDVCNAQSGCLHPFNSATCDDSDACTSSDTCANGACAGKSVVCADGGACATSLGCDPKSGCVYSAKSGTPCSDGNACTSGDVCTSGVCTGGNSLSCEDNNPCTSDSCDPAKGCVWMGLSGDVCSDGSVCTGTEVSPDVCKNGVCSGGGAVSCDDNNLCTNDSCDPTGGCKHASNSGSCSDGNACTKNDVCVSGSCQPGVGVVCSDENSCTSDSCDANAGCVYKKLSDGSACGSGTCSGLSYTGPGNCTSGQCILPAAKSCDDGLTCTTDSCASSGCSNVTKPWGSSCVSASSGTFYPFCAGTTCTGFEPALGSKGVLTGIERVYGSLVACGTSSSSGIALGQGVLRNISETTLGLTPAGSYGTLNSRLNDIRGILTAGGIGDNAPAMMEIDGTWGPWSIDFDPGFSRSFNAIDRFSDSSGDTYIFAGGGNSSAPDYQSNVGRVTFTPTKEGDISRMIVTTSPTLCKTQVAMTINDIYAASNNAVYFAGSIGKNGQTPTKSAIGVWDGTSVESCDNNLDYSGEIYVNTDTSTVDRQANISSSMGSGVYRAIHGTGPAHLLVGGTLGTLWSYDSGSWTQQVPNYTGIPAAWSSSFDVKSVYLSGNDGWATGEYYSTISNQACRQVFVLHGIFDAAAGTWSWNKLWISSDWLNCGVNITNTQANKIWVDASTKGLFIVGAWNGQELIARVKLP